MMAYLDAIGERVRQADTYATGFKWAYFPNDLLSFITRFKNGEIGFPEWPLSYRNIRDHAYFSADDPFPSLAYPMMTGLPMLQAFFRRIGRRVSLEKKVPKNLISNTKENVH